MRTASGTLVFFAALTIATLPLGATPILTNGTWYNFKTANGVDFGAGVGFAYNHSSAAGFYENPGLPPWTFTAGSGGALLTVLDGGELGDIYRVWDFGTSIGTTSFADPGVPGSHACGDFPAPCLADALMSRGFFSLLPGAHSITISIQSTPYPDSNLSWFRVEQLSTVPEPEAGTMALVGLGFLLMAALPYPSQRRKRR